MTPPPHDPAALMWPAPAHEALLRAALGPTGPARAIFQAWAARIDVEHIDVSSQRLLPLLEQRDDLGPWPDGLAEQVRRIQRFAWVQTHARVRRTRPALEALAQAGIPMLLIKGLAVVQTSGVDPRERPMDDVDVVVPAPEADRATAIISALGYRSDFRPDPPPPNATVGHPGTNFEDDQGGKLDLHAHVLARVWSSRADAPLWAAARPGDVLGVPVLVPCREDLVLQAIVHAANPARPSPVRWVSDCALLLREPGFDWDRLVGQAVRCDVALSVGGALRVLDRLTTIDVPAAAIAELLRRPRVLERLAQHAPGRRAPLLRRELLAERYLIWRGRQDAPPRPWAFAAGELGLGTRGIPVADAAPLALGERRAFAEHPAHLTAGFWGAERFGAWSRDRVAVLDLPLAEPAAGPLRLHFDTATLLSPLLGRRVVSVLVGRRRVARWSFAGDGYVDGVRTADVDVAPGTRHLRVRLVVSAPASPRLLGRSGDQRPLGVALAAVTVTPRP